MLVLVSPAKKLDFKNEVPHSTQSEPRFLEKTNQLAVHLKELQPHDIGKLMKLSVNLSDLNFNRFQNFKDIYNPSTSKQAAFAFNGDTYTGLDIQSFSSKDLKNAQKSLRILSGLYGVLKPMDLIQAYRLEMGTRLKFDTYKNLYEYWKPTVTASINKELKKEKFLINCASTEYFGAIDTKTLSGTLITPIFKELRDGQLKIISFSAKKARGMMARYIIQNELTEVEDIKKFDLDNYKYSQEHSDEFNYTFIR